MKILSMDKDKLSFDTQNICNLKGLQMMGSYFAGLLPYNLYNHSILAIFF